MGSLGDLKCHGGKAKSRALPVHEMAAQAPPLQGIQGFRASFLSRE